MKRTPLNRRKPMTARQKSKVRAKRIDDPGRVAWRTEVERQRVCAVTGRGGRDCVGHHVVERQELKRRQEDEWDLRDCLRVTGRAHEQHHSGTRRIRLTELLDQNIEFTFEVMGRAAYVYLTRYYEGHDPRVELALAELEAENVAA